MKKTRSGSQWFFVDESGDPTFFDEKGVNFVGKEGCSPILILGFIETGDPFAMRNEIDKLRKEITSEPFFQGFPSIKKTAIAFHAKDDLPEIRYQFYKLIDTLDFKAQFIVARKIEKSSFPSSNPKNRNSMTIL